MPLKSGSSPKTVAANIRTEMKTHPHMEQKQAIAIAMDKAKQAQAAKSSKKGK